jgi:hypothetical protein
MYQGLFSSCEGKTYGPTGNKDMPRTSLMSAVLEHIDNRIQTALTNWCVYNQPNSAPEGVAFGLSVDKQESLCAVYRPLLLCLHTEIQGS